MLAAKKRMLLPLALAMSVLALSSAALAADSALKVDDPYVRLIPPGAKATGAFMSIHNPQGTDRKLLRAESPVARIVQLHDHINEGGVMKMREVPSIAIKANGRQELKPGSYHVMLIELTRELKEGDMIPIRLEFDDGTKQIEAQVRKLPMGPAPAAHGAKMH